MIGTCIGRSGAEGRDVFTWISDYLRYSVSNASMTETA